MKNIVAFFVASIILFAVSAWAGSESSSAAAVSDTDKHCECIHDDCGCCQHLDWSKFGINGTLCTNFTYLSADYGISITMTYNTYTVFNETVSARNPPPICFGIPDLEKIQAHVCMRFYDLNFEKENFHGCVKVSISVYHVIHKSYDVGCFNIPKRELADVYMAISRRLISWIKEELAELEYLKEEIPFVHMIE